jgi:hypothetical protein
MSHRLMIQNTALSGKPVLHQTLIIDLAEFSLNQLSKQCNSLTDKIFFNKT